MRRRIFLMIPLFAWLMAFAPAANPWLVDFEEAQEAAQLSDKPILLVFSGSDWCKPCIRWEQEVFSTPEFESFAQDHLILVRADFPRKRKNRLSEAQVQHNEALAAQFNPQGYFPYALLLTAEGEILVSTSYRVGGTDQFIRYFHQMAPNQLPLP
ncbi:thioredoxin family protein [Pontibacter sp. G13]|uniref:thioredoxin family protein n=1 Tax=Pontibacter sp. G13 TaxID=3074898 RepID=UPI002889FA9A|nr:thioredoxin family protein [Pontibacter sp. G13]WNJ19660.1 thioredoxin family protein [Pontibacter sp. G13]